MNSLIVKIKNAIKKSPIRMNFLFIILSVVGYFYYINNTQSVVTENNFIIKKLLIELFLFSLWFIAAIISLLFIINSILNYLKLKDKVFTIKFNENNNEISIDNNQIIPNFLGFQYCIIEDKSSNLSIQYLLAQHKLKPLQSNDLENYPIDLVGKFHISKIYWKQNDIFNFFQISFPIKSKVEIVKLPSIVAINDLDFPQHASSKDPEHFSKAPPNEGNLNKIKPFETGDDIRRIVWRVFAKDKSLMVRIMEMEEAYFQQFKALGLFSIDNSIIANDNNYLSNKLLSNYKSYLWTIYKQLSKQLNHELIFNTDWMINNSSDSTVIQNNIISGNWHYDELNSENIGLHNLFIIHGGINLAYLTQLTKQKNAIFLFVPLLDAIPTRKNFSLKNVFFTTNTDNGLIKKIRNSSYFKWWQSNESKVLQLLENTTYYIID